MFEVDEEVANQSHTVKNMIEGVRARPPAAVPVRSQHVAACLALLLGSRRSRLCPQPCHATFAAQSVLCLCSFLLLPPPLQKTQTRARRR